MLDLGEYLVAVAELAAIAVALAFGAVRLRAALLPTFTGAPARLAEAILAVSTLLLVSQALGLLGLFKELPLLLSCVAAGVGTGLVGKSQWLNSRLQRRWHSGADSDVAGERFAAGRSPDERAGHVGSRPQRRARALGGHNLQLGIAAAASAIVFTHWAIPTFEALAQGIYGFDSQWYHLPFAARFAETGEIWDFHYTTPVLLSWFYPANSEIFHGVGIVITERDALSPLVNLGWLGLTLLAAWCLGRPWGVGGLAVLGAFVVLDAGVFADQAGGARNDVMAVALLLSAAALIAQRPAAVGAAALAAGMALGARLTSLAPVAALSVGVIAIVRRGRRLVTAAIWFVPLLLTGGLWYLRNLAATGSPLPQVMDLGPLELPGPDQALGGRPSFSVAHYATDFGVWADWFAPALRDALGLLWPLVLGLAAAGAILALARGPTKPVRLLGAVAIVTALAYLVTPVTASGPEGEPIGFEPNLRYLAPGLALALALLPVALRRFGFRAQAAGAAGLAAAAGAVAAEPDRWEGGYLAPALLLGTLVALVIVGAALVARAHDDESGGRVGPAVAIGLAVLALAAVAVGYFEQRSYLRDRYADPAAVLPNPGLDAVFRWGRLESGERIATTTTRQYPLYGTDLSNRVQLVGIERPDAGFVRAESCEEWRRAVDAGDYDYVVTALDRIEEDGPREPPERAWTAGSPNAEEIVRDGPASVFALSGPLDPGACP